MSQEQISEPVGRLAGRRSIQAQLLQIFGTAVLALSVIPVIALVLIAFLLPNLWLLLLALAVPLILGAYLFFTRRNYAQNLLNFLGAYPASENTAPRLVNMVESLSLSVGIAEPGIYLVEDDCVNAFAIADGDGGTVGFTTGAIEALGVAETEGVVAELLVRIRNGDAQKASVVAGVFGITYLDGSSGSLTRRFADRVTEQLISTDRDLVADRGSIALTHYPPGLRNALVKFAAGGYVPATASAGSDFVWMVRPSTMSAVKTPTEHLSSVELRIDVLSGKI